MAADSVVQIVRPDQLDQMMSPFEKRVRLAMLDGLSQLLRPDGGRYVIDTLTVEIDSFGSAEQARPHFHDLHDWAAILHAQWRVARQTGDEPLELALAKVHNGFTSRARALDRAFHLADARHLEAFAASIRAIDREYLRTGQFGSAERTALAAALNTAAAEHSHDRAWLYVALPTFPNQNYGRVRLLKVETHQPDHPVFITQPTFLYQRTILHHNHGPNLAMARPLGQPSARANTHINRLLAPGAPQSFPFIVLDQRNYYPTHEVLMVPSGVFHDIAKATPETGANEVIPTLRELIAAPEKLPALIANERVGETSCMHLYHPDWPWIKQIRHAAFMQENKGFWRDHDMLVADETTHELWAGGGGAWARRVWEELAPDGSCCKLCWTDERERRLHIPLSQVHDLIRYDATDIQAFHFA